MTIDKAKLKELAEAANAVTGAANVEITICSETGPNQAEIDAVTAFAGASTPASVLALLAEIESLHAQHGRDSGELRKLCSARDSARRQRDRLKAENAKLRGPEETLVVCQKGKPFTFMSKDPCRYSLCEVTYAAPVRALIAERDQLKAENEALRTQAQDALAGQLHLINERDLLKLEIEELRKDAERYRWLRDGCGVVEYKKITGSIGPGMLPSGDKLQEAIDAAMAKEP